MSIKANKKLTVVITGGGTGGHIFPGIAIAQEMLLRNSETTIVFIGTKRRVDKTAMKSYGFKTKSIHCQALKGKGVWFKLKSICLLPISLVESLYILRTLRPDIVIGVGGYVTGPVIIAAKLLGVTSCIHEQNSIPGLANRKLGSIVDRVYLSLPGSESYFPEKKCLLYGNPLRKDILKLVNNMPEKSFPTLAVLGGSQGAHRINQIVPEALRLIKENLPHDFSVIHQTGITDEQYVRTEYENAGIKSDVRAFFNSMGELYCKASIVLSRAGATTLAELTALQLPMVLVPFPFATDDHQKKNAQTLVEKGAAKMILEKDLSAEMLGSELLQLLNNDEQSQSMGRLSGSFSKPDAAKSIVDDCFSLMRAA